MRYAGPPILHTSMSFSTVSLALCISSNHPTPAVNITGLSHSTRINFDASIILVAEMLSIDPEGGIIDCDWWCSAVM